MLAVVLAVVPLATVLAWLVNRIRDDRARRIAGTVAFATALTCDLFNGPTANIVADLGSTLVLAGLILVLNGLGIGSILGWAAVRLTTQHLAAMGALVARALPVVLLTVLVFFNAHVWSMASTITRDRMWLVVLFMTLIAVAFLVTGIREQVTPMMSPAVARQTDGERLADTPFASMPDPATVSPLSTGERFNVLFVLVASQISQVAAFALVTSLIFFALGLVALSPELVEDWTNGGAEQSTLLGMALPFPEALLHVVMFLGALSFMYVSARAVGDGEYRAEFLDPLLDDLRLTLVARARYRAHVSAR